uniref:Uncharacterized protein n=1 Tax=uncultured Alphaproteobacteria bacterium TaxID=91750 RepID=A0A6M4NR16_9PROT|nr:hypothetical protein PlAlph_2600 [uncultured Alphaproteobacteria bacterium]
MEDTFDFIINDEDEVMLLIYVREGQPKEPSIDINPTDNTAVLHRNDEDEIFLKEVPDEVIDSLHDADTLLVCELSREENEEDTKIINAYEADINL